MKVSVLKILYKKVSPVNWILFALGASVGVFAVLFAMQLYTDLDHLIKTNEDESGYQYLHVTKEISLVNTIGFGSVQFKEREINKANKQAFVEEAAPVYSNQFKIRMDLEKFGTYMDLFFQSIPNSFLDVDSNKFVWKEGDEIPIIVSNEFYNILNFGIGPTQGIPPLTKSTLKKKSFALKLNGNGHYGAYRCRIVGFTDRVTTVLVPNEFLTWANKRFSSEEIKISSMLLKVKDPGSKGLKSYLKRNDYKVNADRLLTDQSKSIVKIILRSVFVIGLIIFGLSVTILLLNVSLIFEENALFLEHLFFLGYSRKYILKQFGKSIFLSMVVVCLISGGLLILSTYWFHSLLKTLKLGDLEFNLSLLPMLLVIVALTFVISLIKARKILSKKSFVQI